MMDELDHGRRPSPAYRHCTLLRRTGRDREPELPSWFLRGVSSSVCLCLLTSGPEPWGGCWTDESVTASSEKDLSREVSNEESSRELPSSPSSGPAAGRPAWRQWAAASSGPSSVLLALAWRAQCGPGLSAAWPQIHGFSWSPVEGLGGLERLQYHHSPAGGWGPWGFSMGRKSLASVYQEERSPGTQGHLSSMSLQWAGGWWEWHP